MFGRGGFHEIRLKSEYRRCTESAGSGGVAVTIVLEGTDPLHSKKEAREYRVGRRARNGSVGKSNERTRDMTGPVTCHLLSLGPLISSSLHSLLPLPLRLETTFDNVPPTVCHHLPTFHKAATGQMLTLLLSAQEWRAIYNTRFTSTRPARSIDLRRLPWARACGSL